MLGLVGWANNYFAALGEGSAGGESSVDRRRLSSNNYFAPPPDSVSDRPPEQISESELKLNPFLHFWSLGVEEQFYLVFPLLILGAFSQRVVESPSRPATPATSSTPSFSVLAMADMPAPEKRPAPQKVSDSRRTSLTLLLSASYSSATGSLGIFLVCGVIVGLGISAWMSMQYPQLAFYLLPSRLWELLAGAVLFDARARGAGWSWVPDDACGTCVIVHA
jgi:peptidoglycan/LPS O-acetylase OafA/YrhL